MSELTTLSGNEIQTVSAATEKTELAKTGIAAVPETVHHVL